MTNIQDDSKENLELTDDEASKDSFLNDSQDSSLQSLTNGGNSSTKKSSNSNGTSGGEISKLESRLAGAVDNENGAKSVNGLDAGDGGRREKGKEEEGWRQYLGSPDDELTNIMIRYFSFISRH